MFCPCTLLAAQSHTALTSHLEPTSHCAAPPFNSLILSTFKSVADEKTWKCHYSLDLLVRKRDEYDTESYEAFPKIEHVILWYNTIQYGILNYNTIFEGKVHRDVVLSRSTCLIGILLTLKWTSATLLFVLCSLWHRGSPQLVSSHIETETLVPCWQGRMSRRVYLNCFRGNHRCEKKYLYFHEKNKQIELHKELWINVDLYVWMGLDKPNPGISLPPSKQTTQNRNPNLNH